MSNKNSKKIPKITFAIPIVIAVAVIINIAFESLNAETFTSTQPKNSQDVNTSMNEHTSVFSANNLYSGPFAILDEKYGIDDTVFLIGSEIPLDGKGEIIVTRPDGEIRHKHPFDGSKSAINHYFTPVSTSDLEQCKNCEFFGTWEISFSVHEGISYNPINFKVEEK